MNNDDEFALYRRARKRLDAKKGGAIPAKKGRLTPYDRSKNKRDMQKELDEFMNEDEWGAQ